MWAWTSAHISRALLIKVPDLSLVKANLTTAISVVTFKFCLVECVKYVVLNVTKTIIKQI